MPCCMVRILKTSKLLWRAWLLPCYVYSDLWITSWMVFLRFFSLSCIGSPLFCIDWTDFPIDIWFRGLTAYLMLQRWKLYPVGPCRSLSMEGLLLRWSFTHRTRQEILPVSMVSYWETSGRPRLLFTWPAFLTNWRSSEHSPLSDITLEIGVSYTIEQVAANTSDEEPTPHGVVSLCYAEDANYKTPPDYPHVVQYQLVRLSAVDNEESVELLCGIMIRHRWVISIEELSDESWILMVHKVYCLAIRVILSEVFSSSIIDLDYDNLKPSGNDIKSCGLCNVRGLLQHNFAERIQSMQESLPCTRCSLCSSFQALTY